MSDAGRVSFTSMLTGNVSNLGDLELGLQPDEDKDEEVVEEVREEVDKEVDEDIDEGIEEQHDEHTSEQHDPANLEIKDKIELDELGREILIIEGKNFISVAAPRSMLGDMRGWYTDVWPTFSKIPEHVKGYLFERFKATKNGGNPVPKESIFNRTHKRNKGKGPFIDKKSKRTSETYTKLKEIRSQGSGNTILSPQGSSTFIPEAWAEACGGIKNRHNSYGFGKSNSGSFTFSGTIPSNNTSNLEVEQLKEELQNMKNKQFEMDEKINQLLAITRANHSNFSGHHFSPGQYSSPQYSGPSPGQYPPSASAPAGQYPPPAPAPAHSQYTATGSGQYPPPTPGYYPTPPPGYFMTPATQFHVLVNFDDHLARTNTLADISKVTNFAAAQHRNIALQYFDAPSASQNCSLLRSSLFPDPPSFEVQINCGKSKKQKTIQDYYDNSIKGVVVDLIGGEKKDGHAFVKVYVEKSLIPNEKLLRPHEGDGDLRDIAIC
ncbi:hypothetical protein BUALT_Bualt16G0100000 [Buddleja alternifolia]|uniref:Uncharacterized protein n=1 Tax=Buddleja alternifolia TaxID=168488 RepID=A0AAV6WJP2_9LAMI|nr:hypothetical protein BUALT_Bualt16G0100000 [Buddleja alternifolia]